MLFHSQDITDMYKREKEHRLQTNQHPVLQSYGQGHMPHMRKHNRLPLLVTEGDAQPGPSGVKNTGNTNRGHEPHELETSSGESLVFESNNQRREHCRGRYESNTSTPGGDLQNYKSKPRLMKKGKRHCTIKTSAETKSGNTESCVFLLEDENEADLDMRNEPIVESKC